MVLIGSMQSCLQLKKQKSGLGGPYYWYWCIKNGQTSLGNGGHVLNSVQTSDDDNKKGKVV